MILKFLFWLSLFIVFYSYLGYGILIFLVVRIKRLLPGYKPQQERTDFEPEVSLVISAYNEADYIEKKIRNSLDLDYPAQKLRIIIITDGSTDQTAAIIRKYDRVQLLHEPKRRGKVAAMNRAMQFVR